MPFGKVTREFDHLQYIPVIQRMYDTNSLEEIKQYAGFSQHERFRQELATLSSFGLHKQLEVKIERSQGEPSAARKFSDGKVDTIFSVSNAKIKETYRDSHKKKRYRRKIRNAFVESTVVKSNKALSYDDQNPPHCMNCGATLEAEGENFSCPYCGSHYQAEAYKYLLTRFFIEKVFKGIRYFWLLMLVLSIPAILTASKVITEEQWQHYELYFVYLIGTPLVALFFYGLFKGFKDFFRHRSVQRKVRLQDPNFSAEIFTLRLNDLLSRYPEILLSDEEVQKGHRGLICRSVQYLQFSGYERSNHLEIIECRGQVDALCLQGNPQHVRLKDKHKKFTLRLARVYGTLTPVHYSPDQFTCKNCGSHQMTEQEGMQVCSYCHAEIPMESLDWVLC